MPDEEHTDPMQPQADGESSQPAEGPGPVIDIGFYISALVGLYGIILLIYAAVGSPDNRRSLGHPFVLWWGGLMLLVAILMLGAALLGRRAARRRADTDEE